ncbi:MAG: hypothetical protein JWQ11_98 [Rhizobacter sp.]|nr:hypothetical protein [Rhizobacter sp.]
MAFDEATTDQSSWSPDFGTLDASPKAWVDKRPIRIAILGDFSNSAASGRLDTGAELAARKPIPVEFDNLEDVLARLAPSLRLSLASGDAQSPSDVGVEVNPASLDDFHPDFLYDNLELFTALSGLRQRLNNAASFAKAAADVQKWSGVKPPKKARSRKRSAGSALAIDSKLSDFARLVGAPAAVETEGPIDELLRRMVGPYVKAAPDPKRDALVATVDLALSQTMRSVLHHPDFQNVESLWRGLDFLLRRLETGPSLQVHLVDVSAQEFAADLSASSDLTDSGLYRLLADKPSQEKNGGYALVCGLYRFEPTPPQIELLGRMAKIAAHASAPFVTQMATEALGHRKKPAHPLVAQSMAALKALPQASYLSLLSPPFMLRQPYGKRSDPIGRFEFEEFTPSEGMRGFLFAHPALASAVLLAGAGGASTTLGELPFHYYIDAEGDQIALPVTEGLVGNDQAAWLRGLGVTALMAHKGQPELTVGGLIAVNGAPLALKGQGGASRMAANAKVSVQAAPVGKGVVVAAKGRIGAPVRGGDGDGDPDLDDAASSAGSDSSDADASGSSGGSGDSGDGDLDALLASLGDDTSSSAAAAEDSPADSSSDDAMDPELAALLASLE